MMYLVPERTGSPACKQCRGWKPWGKQSAAPFGVATPAVFTVAAFASLPPGT